MPKYSSELTFREEVAEGTMAFHFNRPNGFEFKPGQHIDITLLNASQTDDEGNMRTLNGKLPQSSCHMRCRSKVRLVR
jgi:hypothetical protein